MIEGVIMALIYIVVLVIVAYIVIWVIEQLGLAIPPKVIQLLWVIVALIALLLLLRVLLPAAGIKIGTVELHAQKQAAIFAPLCLVLSAQAANRLQNRQLNVNEVRRCLAFPVPVV